MHGEVQNLSRSYRGLNQVYLSGCEATVAGLTSAEARGPGPSPLAYYPEFQKSDFWSFFHIAETSRQPQPGDGTRVFLETAGSFQPHVGLDLVLTQDGWMTSAGLRVRRDWALGQWGANPYALDIVRSFIETLVQPPGAPWMRELVESLRDPDQVRDELDGKKPVGPRTREFLRAYAGHTERMEIKEEFSTVTISNSKKGAHWWIQVQVSR